MRSELFVDARQRHSVAKRLGHRKSGRSLGKVKTLVGEPAQYRTAWKIPFDGIVVQRICDSVMGVTAFLMALCLNA